MKQSPTLNAIQKRSVLLIRIKSIDVWWSFSSTYNHFPVYGSFKYHPFDTGDCCVHFYKTKSCTMISLSVSHSKLIECYPCEWILSSVFSFVCLLECHFYCLLLFQIFFQFGSYYRYFKSNKELPMLQFKKHDYKAALYDWFLYFEKCLMAHNSVICVQIRKNHTRDMRGSV